MAMALITGVNFVSFLMYTSVAKFEDNRSNEKNIPKGKTPFFCNLKCLSNKQQSFFISCVQYLVKFGYMVERRSIIFSKLFEGLDLSAAAAAAAAPAAAPDGAAAAAAPATATGATATATATGALSPLTDVVPAEDGATAKGPTVLAPAEVLGTGGSDALGAEILVSVGGWGWGWGWF